MISGKFAVGLVVFALFVSEAYTFPGNFTGNCTWIPFDRPPWCMGYYKCDSCGVQCGCAGGSTIEPCPAPTTKCMSGPGPTCAKAGPGKCDYCRPAVPHHTDYGCSECLSDHECQQNHHPKSPGANYRKFCFPKTGLCDGECGVGGNGYCKKTYGGKKNLCIDADDTGGWCYQCDGFGSKPGKLDKDVCDKGGTAIKHSKTPFCLDYSCASCDQLFNATGKCPSIGNDYGQVCVKYDNYCFDFDAAPCTAFTSHFCPTARHKRVGGACKRNKNNQCVDA
jgi:hypothetical protein